MRQPVAVVVSQPAIEMGERGGIRPEVLLGVEQRSVQALERVVVAPPDRLAGGQVRRP